MVLSDFLVAQEDPALASLTNMSVCCLLLLGSLMLTPSSAFFVGTFDVKSSAIIQQPAIPNQYFRKSSWIQLLAAVNSNEEGKPKKKKKKPSSPNKNDDVSSKSLSKEELVKSIGEQMRSKRKKEADSSLFDVLNPFKAGQKLRKTIGGTLTSMNLPDEKKSIYYLDDRISESGGSIDFDKLNQEEYVPEVLVVGATGEVGRMVVRRLLLDGRFRVRVLVRNLYSETLNMLGTGVTYCQGDLSNIDSLEYAVTDVDKIVFCAAAPRPDEDKFRQKFEDFMKETLSLENKEIEVETLQASAPEAGAVKSDDEWEQLESVVNVRAKLAEQIDMIGLQNLLEAYQHVRAADYGLSQAAKRALFKFRGRSDFNLFAIDAGEESDGGANVNFQAKWIMNQFGNGVFTGKVLKPKAGAGGDAAVVSTRLRSRENHENGIDLSTGFAGFILRLVSDGRKYEIFVRTKEYYDHGVEYVYEFLTATKPTTEESRSPSKFITVRCPFASFKAVARGSTTDSLGSIPRFRGEDVRHIGFRYSSSSNLLKWKMEAGELSSFYLALVYIKLYRSQPEPEFVYLSDARIPPVIRSDMVSHSARQIVAPSDDEEKGGVQLIDDSAVMAATSTATSRSKEETYFKYRGEQMIKNSGLSYCFIRVSGFTESPSGEFSTVDLSADNNEVTAVSRTDIAQVCVSALLDPNALNKCFYIGKKRGDSIDDDLSKKFAVIPSDLI